MLKVLIRLFLAIIVIASLYLIYFNSFSSLEQFIYKKQIVVKTKNFPEIILESKDELAGLQYEYILSYLTSRNLNADFEMDPFNHDIEITYSFDVCDKCILINKDDLLLIKGISNDQDIEISNNFDPIDFENIISERYSLNYTDTNLDDIMYNLNSGLIAYTIVTRSSYLFYKKYYPNLKVVKNLDEINLIWKFRYDDGSIKRDVRRYLSSEKSKNFLQDLKSKYYSNDTITSHIFSGSRIFISDMTSRMTKYEPLFKLNSQKYNIDWKLLAAISYQESKWNNNAVSPTGVRGLMMLTKNTAKMLKVNRLIPEESIDGASRYLNRLRDMFNNYNDDMKIYLMLAAYNLGPGHIQDITNLADKNNIQFSEWNILKEYLLKLHKKKFYKNMKHGYARGWEAVQYVKNVKQYYDILSFLETTDKLNNDILDEVPDTL